MGFIIYFFHLCLSLTQGDVIETRTTGEDEWK
jgi:hypothetical protein